MNHYRTLPMLIGAASFLSSGLALADDRHRHPAGHHASDAMGQPGKSSEVQRTVAVDMGDAMRFTPDRVQAKQGETIRFVVRNTGKLKHEFVLGTEATLKEHAALMQKFPDMEHADENMVTVAPGQTGEVTWKFTRAGTTVFACLQPGHYEAGMRGQVHISGTGTPPAKDAHHSSQGDQVRNQ